MKEIWLIRHGQSQSNAGVPTEHPAKSLLTDLGHQQSRYMAEAIDKEPSLIITSPYTRSKETAQYLLDRFPSCKTEEWRVEEFTYIHPQKYFQTTSKERKPQTNAYWERCEPSYRDGEGAETFFEFFDRVYTSLEELKKLDGFTTVVTHGHYIRMVFWILLMGIHEIDLNKMKLYACLRNSIRIPNVSIMKISLLNDKEVQFSNFIYDFVPEDLRTGLIK